jgi:hypothetical protein
MVLHITIFKASEMIRGDGRSTSHPGSILPSDLTAISLAPNGERIGVVSRFRKPNV